MIERTALEKWERDWETSFSQTASSDKVNRYLNNGDVLTHATGVVPELGGDSVGNWFGVKAAEKAIGDLHIVLNEPLYFCGFDISKRSAHPLLFLFNKGANGPPKLVVRLEVFNKQLEFIVVRDKAEKLFFLVNDFIHKALGVIHDLFKLIHLANVVFVLIVLCEFFEVLEVVLVHVDPKFELLPLIS